METTNVHASYDDLMRAFNDKFTDPNDRLRMSQIRSYFSSLRKKIKDSLIEQETQRIIDEKVKESLQEMVVNENGPETPPKKILPSDDLIMTSFQPGMSMDLN